MASPQLPSFRRNNTHPGLGCRVERRTSHTSGPQALGIQTRPRNGLTTTSRVLEDTRRY